MVDKFVFEISGSAPVGYFSGKYLHTMEGVCTHYRAGGDNSYLYRVSDSQCEFQQLGKYIYSMPDRQCRWYLG